VRRDLRRLVAPGLAGERPLLRLSPSAVDRFPDDFRVSAAGRLHVPGYDGRHFALNVMARLSGASKQCDTALREIEWTSESLAHYFNVIDAARELGSGAKLFFYYLLSMACLGQDKAHRERAADSPLRGRVADIRQTDWGRKRDLQVNHFATELRRIILAL
jgi:hypothetical protein